MTEHQSTSDSEETPAPIETTTDEASPTPESPERPSGRDTTSGTPKPGMKPPAPLKTTLVLEPELKKALLELATRPAVTDAMLAKLEREFLPVVMKALMPRVEHRLISLLVSAEILPRQALDDLERKQARQGNPASVDLSERALGAIHDRPQQGGNPAPVQVPNDRVALSPDPHSYPDPQPYPRTHDGLHP